MNIFIIEGARGTMKSSIVKKLRDLMVNTVSINPTGNKEDSVDGCRETYLHYQNLLQMLAWEKDRDGKFDFILDRFFFSEMVYSTLYKKNYNYHPYYIQNVMALDKIAKEAKVIVVNLVATPELIGRNLRKRGKDKAPLYGGELKDNVVNSMQQQDVYKDLMFNLSHLSRNIQVVNYDLQDCEGNSSVASREILDIFEKYTKQ